MIITVIIYFMYSVQKDYKFDCKNWKLSQNSTENKSKIDKISLKYINIYIYICLKQQIVIKLLNFYGETNEK